MRLVIQRVKNASVTVNQEEVGSIGHGILVLLGVAKGDSEKDADFLADKVFGLRIFDDREGKMNLSAMDVNAQFLIVSQFTLLGSCQKGRRPSFDGAADPATGETLYEYFVKKLKEKTSQVQTGRFRAMMDVALVNDGPVTFILESP